MMDHESPITTGQNSIQLSAEDARNKNILSVITKRTYEISKKGKCELSLVEIPLCKDFIFSKLNDEALDTDIDLYCNKPLTDIVVKGSFYADGSCNKSHVIIEINDQKKQVKLNIVGKRLAYKNHFGKIIFTEPETLTDLPLEYENAYGGIDKIAEEKFEVPGKEIRDAIPDFDWMLTSPYRYPRNPCGKGYLVEDNPRAFENFELPNIEDPANPITPANLVLGDPQNWIYQPLARATTWVNPAWFPRIAYFGFLPDMDPKAQLNRLPEYLQGFINTDILANQSIQAKLSTRASNGASPGLQVPYLAGKEYIRLFNIHHQIKDLVIELPNDRPRIWIDGRKGKLIETQPVIQSIIIEPDANRLSIVWRGSGPALRPYHEEELKTMPYKVEWNRR
jgi:hypothetical protein